MSTEQSFLKKLLNRRVPQIVGLYIAATWMTVEIGEWVTEQLGLSASLVFYLFVVMVALLPAVAVIAWNHGAPGRDQWKRSEQLFLSANAALAVVLLLVVIELSPVGNIAEAQGATIERVLIDETGEEQVFQVAREGFHKRIVSFFWSATHTETSEDEQWESYAIPWLISLDLNRDPLLSVDTPYNHRISSQLIEAGFTGAVGEPLPLALQLARDARAEFLIRGEFERAASGYRLTAYIHSVGSGRLVAEHIVERATLVEAVDELSDQINPDLIGDIERDPDAYVTIGLADAASSSPEALRILIEGLNRWRFENDYPAAISSLEAALQIDPELAQAYVWLHMLQRLNGDLNASSASIQNALRLDYKLDSETLFTLKANGYAVEGDMDKAIRVLEMWTQVHPESEQAWLALAQNLLHQGDLENAKAALLEAQTIDPENTSIYRLLANAEELSGNIERATQLMDDYLDANPEDQDGWISLANMHLRSGQFDQARTAYEQALFAGSDSFGAELGLIRVEKFGGDLEQALRMLEQAIEKTTVGSAQAQLIFDKTLVLAQTGRPQAALDLLDQQDQILRQALPPLMYQVNISELKSNFYLMQGRYELALAVLEEIEAEMTPPINQLMALSRVHVYERMNEVELAQQAFDLTMEFFNNFDFPGREELTQQAQARLYALQGRPAEAVELIQTALEQINRSSLSANSLFIEQLQFALAEYQFADGQLDQARTAVESLLNINQNHGNAQFLLAKIEQAAGQPERAAEVLEALLEQWRNAEPEYQIYQEALALAETL